MPKGETRKQHKIGGKRKSRPPQICTQYAYSLSNISLHRCQRLHTTHRPPKGKLQFPPTNRAVEVEETSKRVWSSVCYHPFFFYCPVVRVWCVCIKPGIERGQKIKVCLEKGRQMRKPSPQREGEGVVIKRGNRTWCVVFSKNPHAFRQKVPSSSTTNKNFLPPRSQTVN